MEWREFLVEMYTARENAARKKGRSYFVSDFARDLGVPEPSMSKYMKGLIPSDTTLHKMAIELGPDVYKAAGRPERMPENPSLRRIARLFHRLPPAAQEMFAAQVEKEAEKGKEAQGEEQQQFAL